MRTLMIDSETGVIYGCMLSGREWCRCCGAYSNPTKCPYTKFIYEKKKKEFDDGKR